ncbi:MAG: YfhO family protein [Candidatus Faecousia sp.]|nr:YfhO family protein [Candidatus Faecousia sp.]
MRLPDPRKRKWNFTALAFLFPFVGMLMVMLISGYKPFGQYSMLYSDMYHQYYPFFVAFRRSLRTGQSLLYNWSIGMGIDYLGLISYYLASPLNLLSVLVPEKLLLSYFSLLMPVKLGLAGLFFALMLRRLYGKNDFSITVFGGLYALCAWALGYQWNVMWLDSFALLPLVVLGEIALLREKRFFLYTAALFFAVFSNYYVGFFVCVFVALVFVCYEICRFPGWKRAGLDLVRIALFSLLAIGMTAILELPALAALQTTQSSVNQFPKGFRMNIATKNTLKGLLDAMRQVAGNMGGGLEPNFKEGLPNLYCGVGTILLAWLFLMAKEVKLRDKVCCVTLLLFFMLSFIIRQLDYIWHGFHFPNMIPYRFSFLYSFVLLYMAYRGWLLRRRFRAAHILAAALLTAGVLCCSKDLLTTQGVDFLDGTLEIPVYILYNLGFLIAFTGALLYGTIRLPVPENPTPEEIGDIRYRQSRCRVYARRGVLAVAVIELTANLLAFGLYFPGTSVRDYPKGTEAAASMFRYLKEREKEPFYRAETTHSQTLNDDALNGYNGISAFTSSANVRVTEFMKALGYGAKNTYNRYCFEESSPVANLFLDLKYMIERDGRDRTSSVFSEVHHYEKVYLLENTAYLPLGFLAEETLAELDFSGGDNAFFFQNALFSAATGLDANVWTPIVGSGMTVLGNGTQVEESQVQGRVSYGECETGAYVSYFFTADRPGFACIHLDLPKRNDFVVAVNGVDVYRETISLPQMLAVGDLNPGDAVEVRVLCKKDETGSMTVTAALLDEDLFRWGYSILNASTLHLTSFRQTRVEGSIRCDRDGLLYTSVPQNGNWHLYVDGQEVEPTLVGDCMISVPLSQGEHSIVLKYRNRAFALGAAVTILCAGVFGTFSYLAYRPELEKRRKK